MELIVSLDGREEKVSVARDGDRWRVTVRGEGGDREHTVDAQRLGEDGRADAIWSLRVDGAQHEVAVAPESEDRYRVSTGRGLTSVTVTDPLTHLARQAHGAAAGGGASTVTAYMPGRVAAVLVEEGAEVAAGQGVVVLEAMKMENEIAPEHAGRVAKIHVEEGQAVEGGDPLFDVAPLDGDG